MCIMLSVMCGQYLKHSDMDQTFQVYVPPGNYVLIPPSFGKPFPGVEMVWEMSIFTSSICVVSFAEPYREVVPIFQSIESWSYWTQLHSTVTAVQRMLLMG